jgi:hypothetical protein
MVNTPLASTAVGVVSPDRSGMASGVNSTFRQVGYATGIAALGSIFSHQIIDEFTSRMEGTSVLLGISGSDANLADVVISGQLRELLPQMSPAAREAVTLAANGAVVDSLNHVTLIAAVIAFAAAACCLALIRQKDFVDHPGATSEASAAAG